MVASMTIAFEIADSITWRLCCLDFLDGYLFYQLHTKILTEHLDKILCQQNYCEMMNERAKRLRREEESMQIKRKKIWEGQDFCQHHRTERTLMQGEKLSFKREINL